MPTQATNQSGARPSRSLTISGPVPVRWASVLRGLKYWSVWRYALPCSEIVRWNRVSGSSVAVGSRHSLWPGSSSISAPSNSSRSLISGTRIRLVTLLKVRPCMPARTASAFAVLPLDSSTTWLPRAAAAARCGRAMFQAARSFTEPNGLSSSSFAYRSM
ncbi:hypothetical protein SGLAM104S_10659 [Streptomyces glaucescens]